MSANIYTLASLSVSPPALSYKELPATNALFSRTPRHLPGLRELVASTVLHVLLIAVLAEWPSPKVNSNFVRVDHHTYSVRFVHLQMQPDGRDRSIEKSAAQALAQVRELRTAGLSRPVASGSSIRPRILKWTPEVPVQPVAQTLVRSDVPPIELEKEVPLPNLILSAEQTSTQRSIAPAMERDAPRLAQNPAVAPILDTPVRELKATELALAASLPQNAATLISLLENPVQASNVVVVPPANQVAPGDAGVTGSLASAEGSASQGLAWIGDRAQQQRGDKDRHASAAGASIRADSEGLTRIELPRDGTFSFVLLGSDNPAPHLERMGALHGKTVYTVYLKVGLRKSWILQYCFPLGMPASAKKHASAPLQAPWPFEIVRPDQFSSTDPEYILVHGIVTEAGKLDQLSMISPDYLANKELLLKSLGLWTFRPASHDGVPVAVEVLLIIPSDAG